MMKLIIRYFSQCYCSLFNTLLRDSIHFLQKKDLWHTGTKCYMTGTLR